MFDEISEWLDDVPFQWCKKAEWDEILNDVTCFLKRYLESGKYADVLKAKSGVGVGFVDGNINILCSRSTFWKREN